MKIVLTLFFLLSPGQQPQGVQIDAPSIEACLEAAAAYLNNERFHGHALRGATCAIIAEARDAKS